jgi:uncharacterized protein
MPRILLFIILFWILYVVIKRFVAFINANKTSTNKPSPEKIIACAQCGLHVPESETRIINNTVYCNNPDCHPS